MLMFLIYKIFTFAGMQEMTVLTISLLLCAHYYFIYRAMPWLRLLIAGLWPWRPQFQWDFWWEMWHWDRFCWEYFGCFLSLSFHRCSIFLHPSLTFLLNITLKMYFIYNFCNCLFWLFPLHKNCYVYYLLISRFSFFLI